MGVGGCGKFLKYSMFLFNFVILISGCGLVGFGIYTRTHETGLTRFSSVLGANIIDTLSLVLIIVGSTVIFLSFLGCCGAIKEVRCMLITFFGLLLVMLVGLIICGILIYVYRGKIENYTLEQLQESLEKEYGKEAQVTAAWDSMQQLFGCCGVQGGINSTESWAFYKLYSDWYRTQKELYPYIPYSCCRDSTDTPNKEQCVGQRVPDKCLGVVLCRTPPIYGPPVWKNMHNDQMYTQGCYTSIMVFFSENIKILSGVIAGITVLMILGMVFSFCLVKRIKDESYY